MANLFRDGGYGVERFHSGMLAYLGELYNEGTREPLSSFVGHLDSDVDGGCLRSALEWEGGRLRPALEWKGIDLVIHGVEDRNPSEENPLAAFEMKVDSVEGRVEGEWQTTYYPRLLPEGTPFRYVTLGTGEAYGSPRGEHAQKVRWVRIRDFMGALEAIQTEDPLNKPVEGGHRQRDRLQDRSFSAGSGRPEDYRDNRDWSIYLLGELRDRLLPGLRDLGLDIEPTVYKHPPGPDTILHFGKTKTPAYMEVNSNSLLNLKVNLEGLSDLSEKKELFEGVRDYYLKLMSDFDPKVKNLRKDPRVKSGTVMSFDVGLKKEQDNIFYRIPQQETVDTLIQACGRFYGNPAYT